MEGAEARVSCPVCLRELPGALINAHLDRCLQTAEGEAQRDCSPPSKRPRLASAKSGGEAEERPEEARPAAAPVFSLFRGGRSPGAPGGRSGAGRGDAAELPQEGGGPALRGASVAQRLEGQPLADRLRPDTLRDYVGQERVLGAHTLLRSLLESHEIPSIILWGPPGCGKVSAWPCAGWSWAHSQGPALCPASFSRLVDSRGGTRVCAHFFSLSVTLASAVTVR